MPGWAWFLIGLGTATVGCYLWLVWYFKDVYR